MKLPKKFTVVTVTGETSHVGHCRCKDMFESVQFARRMHASKDRCQLDEVKVVAVFVGHQDDVYDGVK